MDAVSESLSRVVTGEDSTRFRASATTYAASVNSIEAAQWAVAAPGWMLLGCGALLAIGSFLPWVKASAGIVSFTKNGTEGDGVLTLILAGLIALLFVVIKNPRSAARWVITLGVLAAVISLYDLADVSNKASDLSHGSSGVTASVGIGLILATAASVVIVVGGFLGFRAARPAE